ncbi:AAA family ATPase [Pseudomonas aeruginosa]|uniref:ATP-dependent nuclease n=1 Tax=Pseudomonas aeruginosa TaxID=287 RepID=UPI001CBEA1F3|nr:ATP-binding protein [Pseudomonas aeruginosa]UPZ05858.1 AAA family ATPase [Pseudomonas aeruginosa]
MAVKVKISNLKSIKNLEFDVPMSGAYIISGANGCGKTSLLVALHRMGAPNAFQTGFPGAKQANGIDGLEDAIIEYEINGRSVAYRYNDVRWSATPKANSKLVTEAFSSVHFLKADSSRVEPTANELKGIKKHPVGNELKAFLNSVFDTEKFNDMHYVTLRGRNAVAHLIDVTVDGARKKSWYSEKSFSLGELCVMRLAKKLLAAKARALYIIDEFEMALHPAAQIRLFDQIKSLAKSKKCAVLVSTHSASLIRNARRSDLIYLENNAGDVTVHRNVHPTYALQYITVEEDNYPDCLVFVEDVSAKNCVDAIWRYCVQSKKAAHSFPSVRVVVVGGHNEVLKFLQRGASFIPNNVKTVAALDLDVKERCLPPAFQEGGEIPELSVSQSLYRDLRDRVEFLPWTPEVGVCELFSKSYEKHVDGFRRYCGGVDSGLRKADFSRVNTLRDGELRAECKRVFDIMADQLARRKSWTVDRAKEEFFSYLVSIYWNEKKQEMDRLSGRLFC